MLKQASFTPWFQELEAVQNAFVETVHNRMEAGATKNGTDIRTSKAAKSTKNTGKSDEEDSVDAEDSGASAPAETPSVSATASTEEPNAE